MAAKSNNKYDVFEWIKQVIDSCKTVKHTIVTDRLIYNFYRTYDDYDLKIELQEYQIRNGK